MKKILLVVAVLLVASCKVGEFTPERNDLHEMNKPNCELEPKKCIAGYPW